MRLLKNGFFTSHLRSTDCCAPRARPLCGAARQQPCAVRASRPAAEPNERRAQPYGFGGAAVQSEGSQSSASRPVDFGGGTTASDAASEARMEAVEARLLRRLDAGGAGDGAAGRRTDATLSATTSGRGAAGAADGGGQGSGRAVRGAPAHGSASEPSTGSARGALRKERAADTAEVGAGGPVGGRGGRGGGPATGVGPAKAGRNASAKSGAPREARAPAPARSAPPGERSKRQAKRAHGETTERLAKVNPNCPVSFCNLQAYAEPKVDMLCVS